ncbi:MAG: TadE/TadG family type IV pilus assembly protein [Gulosibacter sp.]|uniref:TadE/TadG family type IV pilus assembly protein n=1 Tax=Gulosibacter sp. TaxID=2817531 RepID=UPI003F916BA4
MHRWNELAQSLRLPVTGRMRVQAAEWLDLRVTKWLRFVQQDRGSASLEFLGVGILLLVPIAYGMLTLVQLEQAMFAVELAARNGARTLVVDAQPALDGSFAAEQIAWALQDHGIDPNAAHITMTCAPNPDCSVLGDTLTLNVRVDVELPFTPGAALAVPVEANATFPRERFEGLPE